MNAANGTFADFLSRLPEPFGTVLIEPLDLREPFDEFAGRFADEPGTVALLSGGGHDSARFNILGLRPWLSFRERDGEIEARFPGGSATVPFDPFDALEAIASRYRMPGELPGVPLSAGLLGYLAYDLKDALEVLPRTSRDDLGLPRMLMGAPSILVVQDRRDGTTTVRIPVIAGEARARALIDGFRRELASPAPVRESAADVGHLVSGLSRDEYIHSVEAVRDYILRGHVYQVNLSQRFETPFRGDAWALFASLFRANPAPFFAFVQAGDHQIVSTSPERFVELRGGKVETRPIKGTRPRGVTPEQDRALRHDLETSPKDDSELSMIVDLLRNDIGRACAAGSVKVVEHKRVEAYENVYHLVSLVEGDLDDGRGAVDLLRATFPGGSITGCPKIRAMEVIDELEPVRRHVYTGSIGYLGFGGSMDLSIAIRTATIADGRLVYAVGGGVVYDSDPVDEYEETLHKGRTLSNVLGRLRREDLPREDGRIGWMDGRLVPMSSMTVSVEEEGFAYGFGFFETLRVDAGRILRLESHLARFRRSWETFFGAGFPDITWKDVVDQVVSANRLEGRIAAVKILASGGKPGSGLRGVRLVVVARPYTHRLAGTGRTGLRLAVHPQRRQSPLADHKSMNYALQRLAAQAARDAGADEAILLNADGSVSETNTANLFCRIGGLHFRPESEHVLPGTMEQAVLAKMAEWGMPVAVRRLSVEDLKAAECVMATNALMGVVPVQSIDGVAIPMDGALAARLEEALAA